MKHFDCYRCKHTIFDREREIEINKNSEPVTIDYFLCNCKEMKEIMSAHMITHDGMPIGKACWTCEGNHYIDSGKNILEKMV